MTEDQAILQQNVLNSIQSLLDDRKLNYISNTEEFTYGLEIGLEIAAIYGDKIHELFKNSKDSTNNITS